MEALNKPVLCSASGPAKVGLRVGASESAFLDASQINVRHVKEIRMGSSRQAESVVERFRIVSSEFQPVTDFC